MLPRRLQRELADNCCNPNQRRQKEGTDVGDIVRFYSVLIYSESLLEDHGVHITRILVSAEAEVSKTVNNILSFIFFNSLKHMRMMPAYQISSLINSKVSESGLIAVRDFFFLISPVEDHDRDLCTLGFYLGDVLFELFLALKVIL